MTTLVTTGAGLIVWLIKKPAKEVETKNGVDILERVKHLEARMDQMEKSVGDLSAMIGQIAERQKGVLKEVEGINKRLDMILERMLNG
jgi:archaellum component FlaC